MSIITFDYLKNHQYLVTTCAQWSYSEWGNYTPDRPLADFISSRKAYAQHTDQLPLTIVAFKDGVPVGMCSLTKTRGILPELTPWLAALYIVPDYRNQGIGVSLEQEIGAIALRMGYLKIYCFTSDPLIISWYQKQGWNVREKSWIRDHEVTVLEKELLN